MKKVYPDAKAALAGLLRDGMLIMAAGAATIYAWGERSYPPLADDVPIQIEAGHDTECDVKVQPRRVRVTRRIADDSEDPKPLAGVDVVQRIGPLHSVARTGADGRFTLDAWILGDHAPVELRRGGDPLQACAVQVYQVQVKLAAAGVAEVRGEDQPAAVGGEVGAEVSRAIAGHLPLAGAVGVHDVQLQLAGPDQVLFEQVLILLDLRD